MAGFWWWRVGFALVVLTGCQDRVQIIQAPPLDGLQSGVFVRLADDRNTQAILTRTESLLIEQPGQGGDRLLFAGYARPVESFAWPAGDLPVLASTENASFLPSPDRQWVLDPGDEAWRSLTTEALAEVPLARPRVADCLSSGGCYEGPGDAEQADCTVCTPEPPAETLMPEPVQWDTWSSCSAGATLLADDDLELQVCQLPELVGCDRFEWQPMLSSTCRELAPCGPGRFAPVRPEDATRLFVDQNTAPGGDGLTEGTALNSLSQAAAIATPATAIYLADGDYDLPVFSTRLNLVGRCPQRVTLSGLAVSNATVSVNRMAVVGAIDVQAGGHLDFFESWIEGAVTVAGATANFETSVLLESLEVVGAARVQIAQSNLRGAILAAAGTVLTGTDVGVAGSSVHTEGAVDLRRSRIDGAGASVMAGGPVVLEDVWWQDSQGCSEASLALRGTTASLTRVSLSGLRAGPLLFDATDAQLDEVLIRDTSDCGPAMTSSISEVTAHRFAAARIAEETVFVGNHSHVLMQDVLLAKGNESAADLATFKVQSPAMLTLERAEIIEQNGQVFTARGAEAELELYDVSVDGVHPVPGRRSRVLEVREAMVRGARIRAVDAVEVVLAARDSTYRLSDFSTNNVINPVRATDEADVEITRAQFDETYGIVGCAQYGAAVRLNDVVVRGVREEGRTERANCPNGVVARGVAFSTSVDGGLVLTRFVVSDTEGSVFLSFRPETILAREGLVQRATVAVMGDEETRLSEFVIRMRYEDVGQALLSR